MLTNVLELGLLIISLIACIISFTIIKLKTSKSQTKTIWLIVYICMIISCIGTILQITLSNILNIKPIYFEYFTYIGNSFLSVSIFFAALIFINTKITFKPKYILLFIIPVLSLLLLWTNDLHHLFYVEYSIYLSDTVFGPFLAVYNIYTIALLLISLSFFIIYSIKNSGFFTKQAIMILLATLIPISLNVLSTLKIIDATIYVTPISFAISIILLTFSIFKFDFLNVTPIALQKVVDRISDGYLVLDNQNCIIDFNQTFLITFKLNDYELRGKNFYTIDVLKSAHSKFKENFEKLKSSKETFSFEHHFNKPNMFFRIEINTIYSKNSNLGTLVLFKDITQHIQDINTIQNKQDQLVEQERLASLGQMIGGIAHNLKTPIMSISGAAEGINDLINELDSSIGNPIVTEQDFHDIAKDMMEWTTKIKSYTEYMSDVITAVKGQATNLSNDTEFNFTITELFKRVNILMKHELKKAVVYLNISTNIDENTTIDGDINSLVQVINNMISNAIQAYNGVPEKEIDLTASKQDNNIVISIKDYGPGLPKVVKDKLFKEMVTTKGKNGTGLGLYMSYSTIKAHFNGNITFETKTGVGTTFNIIIPT